MWTCYSCMCKMFFLLTAVQKLLKKSNEFFQSYDHKCTATFFYEPQCMPFGFPFTGNYSCAHALRCGSHCIDPLYNPLGRSTSIYWSMYQTKTKDGRPTAKPLKQNKTASMTNARGEAQCGGTGVNGNTRWQSVQRIPPPLTVVYWRGTAVLTPAGNPNPNFS